MINSWSYQRQPWEYSAAERARLGFQCPECHGVRVGLLPRQPHDLHHYKCQECGCQWSGS